MECFGSLSLVLEGLRSCWSSVYTGIPKDEVRIPEKEQLSNRLMNLPTRGQAGESQSSRPPDPFISFSLFYFTLYRFFVNVTPCTPNSLISMFLHIHPLSLQPPLKKKTKNKIKLINFTKYWCGSCGVSHSIPFCSSNFTCKCSLQWIIGSKPLASASHSILNPHRIPLGCPVLALCEALDL